MPIISHISTAVAVHKNQWPLAFMKHGTISIVTKTNVDWISEVCCGGFAVNKDLHFSLFLIQSYHNVSEEFLVNDSLWLNRQKATERFLLLYCVGKNI